MADMSVERDLDLEEGECSASDDDQAQVSEAVAPTFSFPSSKNMPTQTAGYRSQIPQIVINSDESDNSSDGDYPPVEKKPRSPSNFDNQFEDDRADRPFVNPLLSNDSSSSGSKRKRNNIWGSVLTEQVLTNEVKVFSVTNPVIRMASRDVESYDYTKAREDQRPDLDINPSDLEPKDDLFSDVVDLEKEVKKHDNRKRKRTVRERLGQRSYNKLKKRTLNVTPENSVAEVVAAITFGLSEPKMDLFTRIVEGIGKELAIKLYYMTEDVEEAGGMMTNTGNRRRTPGGVYIQLLKTDVNVSADTIDAIFANEYEKWKQMLRDQRKMKKAARKKHKQEAERKAMDIDRPDTPTPAEDLEVFNALDSNNECDAADLPERPATPEPKDDSSDGQEEDEEDDEVEDITIAIARAKAAILKRQREMAKRSEMFGAEGKNLVADEYHNREIRCRDNEMMEDGEL